MRFCVIGVGRAGLLHARNLRTRIAGAELAAVCDAGEGALAQAADELHVARRYADYADACAQDDIDAVVIATPTFLHRPIACEAAAQGKHVFLEKPMALTVEECIAINEAVAAAGVKLQIGFMRRFDEGFRRARALLDSGEMGRIMIVKSTGRGPGGPGPWMWDLSRSNGIAAEVNSHDVDTLFWFTGAPLTRVHAEAHNFKVPEALAEFPDFYDNFIAVFRFGDDTLGVIDGTCPAGYGYDARTEVLCEKGVLFIGSAQDQGTTRITLDGQVRGEAVKSWRTLFRDAYLAEMQHFADCIANDTDPCVTGQDGLRAVGAVVAINEAIRTGGPVELGGGGS